MALTPIDQDEEGTPGTRYPTRTSTAFYAAWDLGARDRPLEAISRTNKIDELQGKGEKLDVETLNTQFPGVEWDAPHTPAAAENIWDSNVEVERLQSIINNADGILDGIVVPFAGQALSASADPLGLGIDALTVGASSFLVKSLSTASKIKKLKDIATKPNWSRITAENMVSGAISEGFVVQASKAEQREYTSKQALANVAAGAFISTGIQFSGFKAFETFKKAGKKQYDQAGRIADTALDAGKDPAPVIDAYTRELEQTLALTDDFRVAITSTFENADEILKGAKDAKDVMKGIRRMMEDPDNPVDVEVFDQLLQVGESLGVPKEKFNLIDDNADILSPQAKKNIKTALTSNESDPNFDPKALQREKELDQELPEIVEAEQIKAQADEVRNKLDNDKELGVLSDDDVKFVKQVDKKYEKETEIGKAMDDYKKCVLGVKGE